MNMYGAMYMGRVRGARLAGQGFVCVLFFSFLFGVASGKWARRSVAGVLNVYYDRLWP